MSSDDAHERYRQAARILHDVAKPMRVLSALAWPGEIREGFLAGGADRLPEPTYANIDPTPVIDGVDAARRLLRPGSVVDDWLDGEASSIESTALMLASLGTPAFHAYSRKLYGVPSQPLRYDPTTPLGLARKVHEAIADLREAALLPPVLRTRTGPGAPQISAQILAIEPQAVWLPPPIDLQGQPPMTNVYRYRLYCGITNARVAWAEFFHSNAVLNPGLVSLGRREFSSASNYVFLDYSVPRQGANAI